MCSLVADLAVRLLSFFLFAICVTIYLFLGVSDLEFVGFGSCVELSVLEFRFWVFELLRSGGVFFFVRKFDARVRGFLFFWIHH